MKTKTLIKHLRAVDEILYDLSDRGGIKHEPAQIDDDVLDDIKLAWAKILERTYKLDEGETN